MKRIHSGKKMKDQVKSAIVRSGVLQMAGRVRECSVAILMYHSVMEDPASQEAYLGAIVHPLSGFRAQMELLARRFRPTSLNEVGGFVRGEAELPKRSVAVTFDDGYADNHEIAASVLNEVGVPATFYAAVSCVDRSTLPWPSHLRFCFRNTKKAEWADSSGKIWPLSGDVERDHAFLHSCDECCKLAGAPQDKYVAAIANDLGTHMPVASGSLMMSYEQMRALLRQGHIVGSHTMTHPNMAYVDPEVALCEMTESKQRLEQELGAAVQHFAYPCPALSPHWTEQTVAASRAAGYETAVTTNPGLARSGDDPLRLKRVAAAKTVEELRWSLETGFAGYLR
jgi:peptidoglycan/xylan/chitin deacetylase (PgdA/CDA1 family)